jgi:hypothetical protein
MLYCLYRRLLGVLDTYKPVVWEYSGPPSKPHAKLGCTAFVTVLYCFSVPQAAGCAGHLTAAGSLCTAYLVFIVLHVVLPVPQAARVA